MKAPAFQFYAADWLADLNVIGMSEQEEGVYIHLLAICWREGSLPEDEIELARLTKSRQPVPSIIRDCFQVSECNRRVVEDGSPLVRRLVHPRLEFERKKQEEWREKSVAGGINSGLKRRRLSKEKTIAALKGGYGLVRTKCEPNANQTPTLLSSSSDPPVVLQKKKRSKPDPLGKHRPDCERLWKLQESLREKVVRNIQPLEATDKRLRRIAARLDDGNAVAQLEHVLWVKADEARRRPESAVFFNGDSNWADKSVSFALGQPGPKWRKEVESKLNGSNGSQDHPTQQPKPERPQEELSFSDFVKKHGKTPQEVADDPANSAAK